MLACWTLPNPRSPAYAQCGNALADAQRCAVYAAAWLREASNATALSAGKICEKLELAHAGAEQVQALDLLWGEPLLA